MSADRFRIPQAFWRAVERVGLRAPVILRQAGLPATLHLDGQGFVTTTQFFAIWNAIATLADDPGLAFRLVTDTDTAIYPPSSLAAFHARDYRDALSRLSRFKRLCTPETLQIVEMDGTCAISIEWLHAVQAVPDIAVDVDFASLVELGRRGTGMPIAPLRLELTRTAGGGDAQRAYFDCPIRFGAPRNLLVMRSTDLDRPFPGHNAELLDMLTPALASALGELDARGSLRDQVKHIVKRSLASGRPELADVAFDLGMSERSVQRRITEEGTTFRELVVEARQELGRQLLSDPGTDIEEVSCLLGYQDTSSFYRAFRDWEGVTPARWREQRAARLH